MIVQRFNVNHFHFTLTDIVGQGGCTGPLGTWTWPIEAKEPSYNSQADDTQIVFDNAAGTWACAKLGLAGQVKEADFITTLLVIGPVVIASLNPMGNGIVPQLNKVMQLVPITGDSQAFNLTK